MKRLLLATTCAIAVSASPAFSAPVPYVNWTGCYIGGHVGGGTGQKDFSDQFFTLAGSFAAASAPTAVTDGWLAGGQVGCDYQFPNRWVVGIEGAASWANIRGSSDPFFSGKAVFDAQTNWIASTTARVGYTSDRLFLYAKGGPAWAGDRYQVPGTFAALPFNYQGPETRFGWTIGAGVEAALWQNWSAKFEYAYYDFGTRSLGLVDPIGNFGPAPDPSSIRQRIQTVTVGVNYHFWSLWP